MWAWLLPRQIVTSSGPKHCGLQAKGSSSRLEVHQVKLPEWIHQPFGQHPWMCKTEYLPFVPVNTLHEV
jgi:hypothetical protein